MPTESILNLVDKFVDFYRVYFSRESKEDAIKRINSGDCGTAAVCIGLVAKQWGHEVIFYDCGNHAFVSLSDVIIDTANPHGIDLEKLLSQYSADRANEVTVEELIDGYLEIDALGCSFAKLFLEHFKQPIPEKIRYVAEHIDEFDSIEWVQPHVDRLTGYLKGADNEH